MGRVADDARTAEWADDRIRALWLTRQSALARAQGFRLNGQLVPGSLSDEIIENGRELWLALDSYARCTGSSAARAPDEWLRPS